MQVELRGPKAVAWSWVSLAATLITAGWAPNTLSHGSAYQDSGAAQRGWAAMQQGNVNARADDREVGAKYVVAWVCMEVRYEANADLSLSEGGAGYALGCPVSYVTTRLGSVYRPACQLHTVTHFLCC